MTTSAVFRALADDNRRAMLTILSERSLTSTELAARFDISAPAVSQHLAVLRDAELVAVQRHGKYRVYSLAPEPLVGAAEWLRGLEDQWSRRLDRLETVVERLVKDRTPGQRRGS